MKWSIDELNDVLTFKDRIPWGLVDSLDGTDSKNEAETIKSIAERMAGNNASLKKNFEAWRRWAYLAKIIHQI